MFHLGYIKVVVAGVKCLEYESNAVERISALYRGLPVFFITAV